MTKKGTKKDPYKRRTSKHLPTSVDRRTSTALALRKPRKEQPKPPTPQPEVLAVTQPVVTDLNVLGDEAALGALGLVEVKLAAKEEAVLSRPVYAGDVLVKPTGQPYLSHPAYTKWFNDAFGRLGWSIVPRAKAIFNGKTVVQPFILYIHGQPAAFAYGEQEYHENNREQTYGDAVEATVASALRRCAKRLGVGLELWDKDWLNAWLAEYAVRVWLEPKEGEKAKPAFRRKQDPPFWNEQKVEQRALRPDRFVGDAPARPREQTERPLPQRPREPAERHVEHSNSDEPITVGYKTQKPDGTYEKHFGQLERLLTIQKHSGRSDIEVLMWLKARYGYDSRKEIKRRHYDEIVEALESKGPLPLSREPGEEG